MSVDVFIHILWNQNVLWEYGAANVRILILPERGKIYL